MKHLFVLFSIAMLLGACRNMTFTKETENGTVTAKMDVGQVLANGGKWTKKMKELEKLEPMTIKELVALMPKAISGFKLVGAEKETDEAGSDEALNEDETDMSELINISWINAAYRRSNGVEFELTVQDCAGQSAYMSILAGSHMNMSVEANDGEFYTKTIAYMGGTAIEMADKKGGSAMLTFLANGRFRITAATDDMDTGELKEVMKNLKLKL